MKSPGTDEEELPSTIMCKFPTTTDKESSGNSSSSEADVETVVKKGLHGRSRLNRLIALASGVVLVAATVVGVSFFLRRAGVRLRPTRPSTTATTSTSASGVSTGGSAGISLSELALHDTPEDCWMAIHGVVYDLTEYAPTHPAGPNFIYSRCGEDGTSDYDRFHISTVFLDVVASNQIDSLAAEVAEEAEVAVESGNTIGKSRHVTSHSSTSKLKQCPFP